MLGAMHLLLVPDRCFYFSYEFRRRLSNSMLLRVFHGVLQEFFLGLPTNDVLASGRWINLGALDDFPP